MINYLPKIRNAVRALIVRDEQVLLLHKQNEQWADYYGLPGGGQDVGENLFASLQRECLEEIATEVHVLDLLHVADYFKEKAITPPATTHLVEFIFRCQVPENYIAKNGERPDKHQVGVEWIELDKLGEILIFPKHLSTLLLNNDTHPVYLGTIK